ncbi:MAG: iron ABC transporter permease, partial [Spirochaetaceae bacterium]
MSVSPTLRIWLLVPLLFAAMLVSLLFGSVAIPPAAIARVLLHPAGPASEATEALDVARVVIREVRLPRVLLAVGAGAALGLAGLLMQTVFRNPLAGPGVLGVSAGAGLGVALVVLSGVGGQLSSPAVVAAMAGAG